MHSLERSFPPLDLACVVYLLKPPLGSSSPWAYNILGDTYLVSGRIIESLREYRMAMSKPKGSYAADRIATLFITTGQMDSA